MRQRTAASYARQAPTSSIAAQYTRVSGSLSWIAAARSLENVAMPHRRGGHVATRPIENKWSPAAAVKGRHWWLAYQASGERRWCSPDAGVSQTPNEMHAYLPYLPTTTRTDFIPGD